MSDCRWLKHAVIYHIFVDRFFRGGGSADDPAPPWSGDATQPIFCGGNLQGVARKMDYLADLGINTVWLSPFNRTTAYHGYHVTDFFRVEERFGGEKGFRELVRAAQSHRIRLVMDLVPNHVSVDHPSFQKARWNPRSPFRAWFYWDQRGEYGRYLDVPELAKLNLDGKPAREHIIGAAKHWLDQGISGFRLDHALGPSLAFWQEFRQAIQQHAPGAALFGEVLFAGIQRQHLPSLRLPDKRFYFLAQQLGFDVTDATMKEYTTLFDGLLDFSFRSLLVKQVAHPHLPVARADLQQQLDDHYAAFPENCALLSFLDNHDLNRFLFEAHGNKSRLRRAAEIKFAQPHPPVIYYGTELGMNQTGPIAGYQGDLRARGLMTWDKPDRDLFKFYQKLIATWKQRQGNA